MRKTVTDALPDILKALEAAEDSTRATLSTRSASDKDLTLSAADRAELSAASGRIQTNSAKPQGCGGQIEYRCQRFEGIP